MVGDNFSHFLPMQSEQSIQPHFVAHSLRCRCVISGMIAVMVVVLTEGLF